MRVATVGLERKLEWVAMSGHGQKFEKLKWIAIGSCGCSRATMHYCNGLCSLLYRHCDAITAVVRGNGYKSRC